MSELAAKLARRRTLNGEGGSTPMTVEPVPSMPPVAAVPVKSPAAILSSTSASTSTSIVEETKEQSMDTLPTPPQAAIVAEAEAEEVSIATPTTVQNPEKEEIHLEQACANASTIAAVSSSSLVFESKEEEEENLEVVEEEEEEGAATATTVIAAADTMLPQAATATSVKVEESSSSTLAAASIATASASSSTAASTTTLPPAAEADDMDDILAQRDNFFGALSSDFALMGLDTPLKSPACAIENSNDLTQNSKPITAQAATGGVMEASSTSPLRRNGNDCRDGLSNSSNGGSSSSSSSGISNSLFDETESGDDHHNSAYSSVGLGGETAKQNAQLKVRLLQLVNELKTKNERIAVLEQENADLRKELEIKHGSSTKGFSLSKSRIRLKLSNMGYDPTQKTVEHLFADRILDNDIGGGDIAEGEEDEMDTQQFLSSTSSPLTSTGVKRFDASQSISENLLIESNLLMGDVASEQHQLQQQSKRAAMAAQKLSEHGISTSATSSSAAASSSVFGASSGVTPAKKKVVDQEALQFSYQEFVDRLMKPECETLVDVIRKFLSSVLGPNGDATPPPRGSKFDYVFYGTEQLARRCGDFFEAMQGHFQAHPLWRDESEDRILSARDCLERHVMTRIAEYAFKSVDRSAEDEALSRRMRLLEFLRPEVLDIKPELQNEMIWAVARDELKKINSYKTPGEKIACVVKCATVIFRSISLVSIQSGGEGESACGADDFLPVFIWVVLRCHVPKLYSNCEYIQAFHNPARLMGKSGYCFVNLLSALEFVSTLDADSVSMPARDFEQLYEQATRELNGGF